MLEKGIFTISIDHEFAWGYADMPLRERDRARILGEHDIARRLLALFERYRVPATWAVVGHLLERECGYQGGMAHPEYPRPIYTSEARDWFFQHPSAGKRDPLWFDTKDFMQDIAGSNVGHEIASHSYAHILYGAPAVREEAVRADLENVRRVHGYLRTRPVSFVFPRNQEGYHRVLKEYGFASFRGDGARWYKSLPSLGRRAGHLIDYLLPTVRTMLPQRHFSGLVDVPGSMLLLGRDGLRGVIAPSVMQWKAGLHIRQAVRRKEVFHLWFHPSNFSYGTDTQFQILEAILKEVVEMRDRNKLDVLTMREVAKRAT